MRQGSCASQILRTVHVEVDGRVRARVEDDIVPAAQQPARPLVAGQPGEFDRLRKTYQERREWSSLEVICNDAESASLLNALGFCARLNNS